MSAEESKHEQMLKKAHLWIAVLGGSGRGLDSLSGRLEGKRESERIVI